MDYIFERNVYSPIISTIFILFNIFNHSEVEIYKLQNCIQYWYEIIVSGQRKFVIYTVFIKYSNIIVLSKIENQLKKKL